MRCPECGLLSSTLMIVHSETCSHNPAPVAPVLTKTEQLLTELLEETKEVKWKLHDIHERLDRLP